MPEVLLDILKIIGSLGLFIYGMKVMSEGIQRAAGTQLRNILRRMTKNRYIGVFSGFLITALVQSSSATTVMTVSFVNAGLLSLAESAGVMMGANVGTTITGWLVAVGTGNFEISDYVLPIVGIGLPMIYINRGKSRYWGEFLIGFGLLFLGLYFLKENVPDLQANPGWLEFLREYANTGYLSILVFVIIGATLTIIVQSSSAAMALTLVMLAKDWIPMETAAAMILGENIGTTITAEVAAIVGNVHAKRSARIHSLFNLIGVGWMILLLPFIIPFLNNLMEGFFFPLFPGAEKSTLTIAAFHSIFNLANVLLLIGFTSWLIVLAKKTIPSKSEDDEVFKLEYINALVKTPELSIIEVQKEMIKFGELAARMSVFTREYFMSTDPKEQKQVYKRIKKYERITDRINLELTSFLAKVSGDQLSPRTSNKVKNLLSVCSDLESIGNIYFQIAKSIKRKIENKIWFNQVQRQQMNELFDLIDKAFEVMIDNLSNQNYDKVTLASANAIEKQINKFRKAIRNEDLPISEHDIEVNLDSQIIFSLLVSQLEKVGNNVHHISEAIADQV